MGIIFTALRRVFSIHYEILIEKTIGIAFHKQNYAIIKPGNLNGQFPKTDERSSVYYLKVFHVSNTYFH